jgi:hypothetical protein
VKSKKIKAQLICDHFTNPSGFLTFQNYFLLGLSVANNITFQVKPLRNKLFFKLYKMNAPGVTRLWRIFNSLLGKKGYRFADRVGRYIFSTNKRQFKVALDMWDDREILDQDALNWSHIYFKSNKWPNLDYPAKVFPLVHGNGKLTKSKITLLKNLRNCQCEYDLNYMSRLWFWPDDRRMHNLMEHHVRTFETLSKIDCKKKLLAVLPSYWPEKSNDRLSEYLKRLDRASVPWQYSWKGISSEILFNDMAKSKIVFLRPGNALCISWRMIDLLCLGACIVCDGSPYPSWPAPLEENKNFADCNCGIRPDYSIPPIESYQNFRIAIEGLLASPQRIEEIKNNNRSYFDNYASPEKMAAYVVDTVMNYSIDGQ